MPPKPFPTHFLCIPLVTASSRPQLSASLATFSTDVTSPDSFAVPARAIRPVGTLHLTLCVMSFPKNEGIEKAVELLKMLNPRDILSEVKAAEPAPDDSEKPKTALPGPIPPLLSVTLKGLHSMQAASQATTLYASPVDPAGTLQRFCERVKQVFEDAEVIIPDKRPLLLHATIVNTIYIKGRGKSKRITLDARGILDRYDDHVWMEDIPIEKIAICRMGAKASEDGQDEAYEVEAEIDIGAPE